MATRFSALCVICFAVPLAVSVPHGRHPSLVKGISRNRRDGTGCQDGFYDFEGRSCCYCPVGQHVVEHCTNNMTYGKCVLCEDGTYSSHPNSQKTCQPCTSCDQDNANLEEEEPCTPGRDAKCRCKKEYFCNSKECPICHPCKTCGVGGIETDCTPTSDRICSNVGVILIVFVVMILLVGVLAGVVYWVKARRALSRKRRKEKDEENQRFVLLLDNVDIEPFLPDIAPELGWGDMKNIAQRTEIKDSIIEAYEIDYKNSAEERTLQLLKRWVEKEGKKAPNKLVQTLKEMNKMGKAEKIIDILLKDNSASSSNSRTNN